MTAATFRDKLGRVCGRRPSRDGAEFLFEWLLPGEPLLTGISGTQGIMPSFLVVTPDTLFWLEDRTVAQVSPIPLDDVTAYEITESWSGPRLILTTVNGAIQISSVGSASKAQEFCFSLQRAIGELGPLGFPQFAEPLMALVDRCFDAVEHLRSRSSAEELFAGRSSLQVASHDALTAAQRLLWGPDIGYELTYLYLILHRITNPGSNVRRRRAAQDAIVPLDDRLLVPAATRRALDVLPAGETPAHFLADFVRTLGHQFGHGPGDYLKPYRDLANSILADAGVPPSPAPPVAPAIPAKPEPANLRDGDLVGQLERLSELLRSGVLNDEEFTRAKNRLLGRGDV